MVRRWLARLAKHRQRGRFRLETVRKAVLFPEMMKLIWEACVCCVLGACWVYLGRKQ